MVVNEERKVTLLVPSGRKRRNAVDGRASPETNQRVDERPVEFRQTDRRPVEPSPLSYERVMEYSRYAYEQAVRRNPDLIKQLSVSHDRVMFPMILKEIMEANRKMITQKATLAGCSPSCLAVGAMDLLKRRPSLFTFEEAYRIQEHLNVDLYLNLMKKVILNYSMKICGFPDCPDEDLPLAVYFFIEKTFGIATKIHLCVRYAAVEDSAAVGVVFDSVLMKRSILKKAKCLEGTDIVVSTNNDIGWILDGFCSHNKDPGMT